MRPTPASPAIRRCPHPGSFVLEWQYIQCCQFTHGSMKSFLCYVALTQCHLKVAGQKHLRSAVSWSSAFGGTIQSGIKSTIWIWRVPHSDQHQATPGGLSFHPHGTFGCPFSKKLHWEVCRITFSPRHLVLPGLPWPERGCVHWGCSSPVPA